MDNETGSMDSPTITMYSDGIGWEYVCRHCSKTFPTGRALGGHQNAHRFEPKERRRVRHGRMPKLQMSPQPPTPPRNSHVDPSRHASALLEGSRNRFQAHASGSRAGLAMQSGPGNNFYQNDSKLVGPKMSPFCNLPAEEAEIQSDSRDNLDLDLKLSL